MQLTIYHSLDCNVLVIKSVPVLMQQCVSLNSAEYQPLLHHSSALFGVARRFLRSERGVGTVTTTNSSTMSIFIILK